MREHAREEAGDEGRARNRVLTTDQLRSTGTRQTYVDVSR
jgi:hypothetical protein